MSEKTNVTLTETQRKKALIRLCALAYISESIGGITQVLSEEDADKLIEYNEALFVHFENDEEFIKVIAELKDEAIAELGELVKGEGLAEGSTEDLQEGGSE